MMRERDALLERVILGIFHRGRGGEPGWPRTRVTALLTHHFIGVEEGIRALKQLRLEPVSLSIWTDTDLFLDHRWELAQVRLIRKNDAVWLDGWLDEVKESFDFLLIPVLSFSLISHLVRLDDTHPFVRLIVWALLSGKEVGALAVGGDPYHAVWGEQRLDRGSPLLKQEIRRKLQTLRGFGIQLVDPVRLGEWIRTGTSAKKPVLTGEGVRTAVAGGKIRLKVSRDTIVTPLAEELAREHRLDIERE